MSITQYINNLKELTNLSFAELAKVTGIKYQNLMDIKNGRINTVTAQVLDKLTTFENRPTRDILFDILYKEQLSTLLETCSYTTLIYACNLYLNKYNVSLEPNYPSLLSIKPLSFEALCYKKRISNQVTLIDSFEYLKKEHFKQLRTSTPYHKDAYADYFQSEKSYLFAVLTYAIGKTMIVEQPYLVEYVILFDKKTHADLSIIESFNINKANIKIRYIYLDV